MLLTNGVTELIISDNHQSKNEVSFDSLLLAMVIHVTEMMNPFTRDSAKSKIDKFPKITNWLKLKNKQHHSNVLLNSFPMNGHTAGFRRIKS